MPGDKIDSGNSYAVFLFFSFLLSLFLSLYRGRLFPANNSYIFPRTFHRGVFFRSYCSKSAKEFRWHEPGKEGAQASTNTQILRPCLAFGCAIIQNRCHRQAQLYASTLLASKDTAHLSNTKYLFGRVIARNTSSRDRSFRLQESTLVRDRGSSLCTRLLEIGISPDTRTLNVFVAFRGHDFQHPMHVL